MSFNWTLWPGPSLPIPPELELSFCHSTPSRLDIRTWIVTQLKAKGLDENTLKPILNLQQPPQCPGWRINLSHCPEATVVALRPGTEGVLGIDLEIQKRVSEKIIMRLSSEMERQDCPDPRLIFSAKEAGWKALNSRSHLPSLSHLQTQDWQPLDHNTYSFKLSQGDQVFDVQGLAQVFSQLQMCLVFDP